MRNVRGKQWVKKKNYRQMKIYYYFLQNGFGGLLPSKWVAWDLDTEPRGKSIQMMTIFWEPCALSLSLVVLIFISISSLISFKRTRVRKNGSWAVVEARIHPNTEGNQVKCFFKRTLENHGIKIVRVSKHLQRIRGKSNRSWAKKEIINRFVYLLAY